MKEEGYVNHIHLDKRVYIRHKQLEELILAIDQGTNEGMADTVIETFNYLLLGLKEAFKFDLEFLSSISHVHAYPVPTDILDKEHLIEKIRVDIHSLLGATKAFIELYVTNGPKKSEKPPIDSSYKN